MVIISHCDNITLWYITLWWYHTLMISHCDIERCCWWKNITQEWTVSILWKNLPFFLLKSDQCCEMEVKHVSWSHFWQRFAVNREFQIWGDFAIGWFSTMLSRYFLQLQHTCKTQCIFSDFSTYFLNVFWRKQQECNPGGQNPSFSCSCSFCNDISSLVQCQQRTKI